MSHIANPTPSSHHFARPTSRAKPELEVGALKGPVGAHFREAGAGRGVVCLHARASSSAQWRPLMDRLASRFRTLAADLYGSGQSPAIESFLDTEAYAPR